MFTSGSPTQAVYQALFTYAATATGNPQPTFLLLTGPAGMQIDPYTGLVTWTPQADQLGSNAVLSDPSAWVLMTSFAPTNDTFVITDSDSAQFATRFYRVLEP